MKKTLTSFILLLIVAGASFAEEASDILAERILEKIGMRCGVVSLPSCDNIALATAFAKNPGIVVHAMSTDRKIADGLVKKAEAEGLLSRSLYVKQRAMNPLPFAANMVDLVVVVNMTDDKLLKLPASEILRVLSPWRGRAIIGRASTSQGGKLSQAALKSWAEGAGQDEPDIWQDDSGVWVYIKKGQMLCKASNL